MRTFTTVERTGGLNGIFSKVRCPMEIVAFFLHSPLL